MSTQLNETELAQNESPEACSFCMSDLPNGFICLSDLPDGLTAFNDFRACIKCHARAVSYVTLLTDYKADISIKKGNPPVTLPPAFARAEFQEKPEERENYYE